jgi:hypothetical protein
MIARFRPWRSSRRLLAVAAALLIGVVPPVSARDFDVEQVTTRLEDGTYAMDARIRYDFSDRALEALENGVPLTVDVHIQVRPEDDWIWTKSLTDRRLRYRIQYKPLVGALSGRTAPR